MLFVYRLLQLLLSPLLILLIGYRYAVGREDRARFAERLGRSNTPRPLGTLIWFHGASVGEVSSLAPILEHLRRARPDLNLLLTTGTQTGRKMLDKLATTLPGTGHTITHYVPLDTYFTVRPFIQHWHPTLSVFVESEFWPELVSAAPNPTLLNGRISDRSWPRYQQYKWFFRPLLARYHHIMAQRQVDAERLHFLGAKNVTVGGNLKFDAPPLIADTNQLDKFRDLIHGRPTLVVASTHPGEEELAAKLHMQVKAQVPDVLTIIVPRHPHRGTAAANEVQRITRNIHRRGTGDVPHLGGNRHTDIYIADTLGELGLWYRLATVAIIGGSMVPHGGHNPLEPLKLGIPTATGPHMFNFQDMIPALTEHNLLHVAASPTALGQHIVALLTTQGALPQTRQHIRDIIPTLSGSSHTAATIVLGQIPPEPDNIPPPSVS